MDSQTRAKMLLVPNAQQTQQEISQAVDSILASDPERSLEEVQRAETIRLLAPALERFHVTVQEEPDLDQETVIRQEVSQRTQRILANHERLAWIVKNHGRALQRRWKKRKPNQRKKLLLDAWPGMAEVHRPDFQALREQRALWVLEHRRDGAQHRDAYLFPHVNLEDLSNNKNFLLFIESRALNGPEIFAWSDSQQIRMAASAGAIRIVRVDGYTMMLGGQIAREKYADIVSWNSDFNAIQDLLMGKGFHLSEGLIVLEIQDRTLEFLVACTELMLHDHGIKAVATSDLSTSAPAVDGGLISENETSQSEQPAELQSMVEVNTEAAYRLPQQFPLEYLRKLASAKRDEAEDEIWALREDPSYFQEVFKARYEMMLYTWEKVYKLRITELRKENSMHAVCRTTVHDPYKNLIVWNTILADLQKLEVLRAGTATSSIEPSPKEYQDSLANLVLVMDKVRRYPLVDLRKILPMSEPLRRYFDCTVRENQSVSYHLRKGITIPPILEIVYDLMHDDRTSLMGVPNILDVIERIMGQDTEQKGLITTGVAKTLSETAAIGEIHTRLSRYQPRIQLPMDLDSSIAGVESRLDVIAVIQDRLKTAKLGAFVTPFADFKYPPPGKRQENIDRRRAEEAMLDTFWRETDQHFAEISGKTLSGLMQDRITERKIERTPPWQPPAVQPKHKKAAIPKPTSEEIEALRTFPTDAESSTPPPTRPKEKVKTRGVAAPPSEPAAADEPETDEPPAQTFALPKGAYKTMRAFFPADVQDHIGSKVLWKDFVSAMQRLGFGITSLNGSASLFEPAWRPESSIIFHEPHPGNEIRFDLLRRYGGRLYRKYGWTTETFVQV